MTSAYASRSREESPLLRIFCFDGLVVRSWDDDAGGEGQDLGPSDVFVAFVSTRTLDHRPGPLLERLEAARRGLRSGGVLLFAIPNRLGLRFWSGTPDPGDGSLFRFLGSDASLPPAGGSMARQEVVTLLAEAGFHPLEWFYVDAVGTCRKRERSLVSERLFEAAPGLAAELLFTSPSADESRPRLDLFSEALAAQELARSGLLREFATSFLIAATPASDPERSPVWERLRPPEPQVGWHLAAAERREAVTTWFEVEESEVWVEKRLEDPERPPGTAEFLWRSPGRSRLAPGEPLRLHLERLLIRDAGEEFYAELERFFHTIRDRFGRSTASGISLAGEALDALFSNATRERDGAFHLFDLEWRFVDEVPASWWTFRNVQAALAMRGTSPAGAATPRALYESLCSRLGFEPALADDLDRETRFAAAVGLSTSSEIRGGLLKRFEEPWPVPVVQGRPSPAVRSGFELEEACRRAERWAKDLERSHATALEEYRRLEAWAKGLEAQLNVRQGEGAR